jgi:hypothetical protein
MEFNDSIKEQIKAAKIATDSVEGLSEKEKEIVFSKMVDKILNSKQIVNNDVDKKILPQQNALEPARDIQELYHNLKPKTGLDEVMFIAYYFYTKKQSFTVKDLLENYKILLLPSPSNPSDLINKNRMKGYIMLNGKNDKKINLFSITRKGIPYVEGGFKEVKNDK